MEKKFTQGEWKVNWLTNPTDPHYACIYAKEGDHTTVNHVCTVTREDAGSNWKNNIALISAAPDLLEALQAVMKHFPKDVLSDQMNEDYDLIESAIAKALNH